MDRKNDPAGRIEMTGKEKPESAWPRNPGSISELPSPNYDTPLPASQLPWRAELAERLARCRGLGIDADLGNLDSADAFGLLIFLRGRS